MLDSSESSEQSSSSMGIHVYRCEYSKYTEKGRGKFTSNMCDKCKEETYQMIVHRDFKEIKSLKKCSRCNTECLKLPYRKLCTGCSVSTGTCARCCGNMVQEKAIQPTLRELSSETAVNKIYKSLSKEKQQMFYRFLYHSSRKESRGLELNITQGDIYRKLKALKLSDKKKTDKRNEEGSSYDDSHEDYETSDNENE